MIAPRLRPDSIPLVLIVDDHADSREIHAFALQSAGMRWTDAVSGQDAITQAHNERPDLILMDLMMPRLDGWEAIRQLRADDVTRSIPFVIVTADDSPEVRSRAVAAGAAGFLLKPVTPEALVGEVTRVLGNRRD